MTKFDGIIFDMDGLLFDTEAIYYAATQKVADEMGIPYTKERYLEFLGVSDEEVFESYHIIYQSFGKEVVDEFIRRSYEEVYQVFSSGTVPLKEGGLELLDYLDQKNVPRVVASSNVRSTIDLLLTRAGINDRFAGVLSAEDVTRAKPDSEIFDKARNFLGTSPERTLILEDSEHGISAAEAAGIPVIMVPDLLEPTAEIRGKALTVLNSLKDVPAYLSK